jgi:hypothetical protein
VAALGYAVQRSPNGAEDAISQCIRSSGIASSTPPSYDAAAGTLADEVLMESRCHAEITELAAGWKERTVKLAQLGNARGELERA